MARSVTGLAGPVTLKPPEDGRGNVLLFRAADDVLSYAVLPRGPAMPIPGRDSEKERVFRQYLNDNPELKKVLRLNHFADCPEAEKYRRHLTGKYAETEEKT